jgi:hypothetical protein
VTDLKKIPKYKKLTTHQAGVDVFYAGGRAKGHDMTKLMVPLRNFTNTPKNRCTCDLKYQSKICTIINVSEDTKWKLWHVGCVAHKLSARSKCVVEKLTVDWLFKESSASC